MCAANLSKTGFNFYNYFKKNSYLIYSYLLFIAPILNIFGYWQYNLSNTMYSGLSLEIELVLNDDGVNCFPAKFNNNKVYEYESDSSFAFDLDDWVLNELNVPYYSEQWIIPYFQKKYCTCLMQYKGFIRIEKSFRWTKNKEITIINCS